MLTNLMNMSGWLWLVVVQYGGLGEMTCLLTYYFQGSYVVHFQVFIEC